MKYFQSILLVAVFSIFYLQNRATAQQVQKENQDNNPKAEAKSDDTTKKSPSAIAKSRAENVPRLSPSNSRPSDNAPSIPTGKTGTGGLNTHPPMYSPGSPVNEAKGMADEIKQLSGTVRQLTQPAVQDDHGPKIVFKGAIVWYNSQAKQNGLYRPQSQHLATARNQLANAGISFQGWDVADPSTQQRFKNCLQDEVANCRTMLSEEAIGLQALCRITDGSQSKLFLSRPVVLKEVESDLDESIKFIQQMDLPLSSDFWKELPENQSSWARTIGYLFGIFTGLVFVVGLILEDRKKKFACFAFFLLVILTLRIIDPQGFAELIFRIGVAPTMILGGVWLLSLVFGISLRPLLLFNWLIGRHRSS